MVGTNGAPLALFLPDGSPTLAVLLFTLCSIRSLDGSVFFATPEDGSVPPSSGDQLVSMSFTERFKSADWSFLLQPLGPNPMNPHMSSVTERAVQANIRISLAALAATLVGIETELPAEATNLLLGVLSGDSMVA